MRKWVPGVGESKTRRFAAVFVTAAALLAGACGAPPEGVGSATPAPGADHPASTPTPATARPRLVILGDSIASGYGLRREESFPARLQERIDREGLGFEVVNAGVSGDTSAGGLRRLDWALDGDVRVLVVELGGNDGLRGLPLPDVKSNLDRLIRLSQQGGARVLLVGMRIPPNYGPEYTRGFQGLYTELATRHGVPLIPFFLDGVALDDTLMQDDGIHPNAAAQPRLLAQVWPKLEPLLAAGGARATGGRR